MKEENSPLRMATHRRPEVIEVMLTDSKRHAEGHALSPEVAIGGQGCSKESP